jgi:hypothetical protein
MKNFEDELQEMEVDSDDLSVWVLWFILP